MKESGLLKGWWGSTFGSNRRIVFLLLTNFLRSRSIHSVSFIIITKKPGIKFVKMFHEIKQKYFIFIHFYLSPLDTDTLLCLPWRFFRCLLVLALLSILLRGVRFLLRSEKIYIVLKIFTVCYVQVRIFIYIIIWAVCLSFRLYVHL